MVQGVSDSMNPFFRRQLYKIKSRLIGLKDIGSGSCIIKPLKIERPKTIVMGCKVTIHDFGWLMGGFEPSNVTLKIDDGATIGHFSHIVARFQVIIEKNVLVADKVFISDCTHNYSDINIPIIDQGVSFLKPVRIGEGSWLGENVCVCGASIGKHCVIGANSVVTKDIPDYCVAVGNPARIVKKYDFEKEQWVKV